jgi:hypothetical protein
VPLALGLAGTLVLLGVTSRRGEAAQMDVCSSGTKSLCMKVETCQGGFEANGTCRWNYSVRYYYWQG